MRANKYKGIILIGMFCLGAWSSIAHSETVQEYMRAFHDNPQRVMDRLPNEVDIRNQSQSRGYIDKKRVNESLGYRNQLRIEIMNQSDMHAFSDINSSPEKDRPERLIEPGAMLINLRAMEEQQLMKGASQIQPWSDSYWPLYKGMTAIRYSGDFPNSGSWIENFNFIQAHPASSIVSSGNLQAINQLSPAEKYDFVMGDTAFTLTKFAWSKGREHFDSIGHVAKWMGICHGWAGASHMNAVIPEGPIVVTSHAGTPVTFYPQDIKALQSMLWANSRTSTRFVGDRCDTYNPERNAYGRVTDPKCFDVNPGTWHLAVINQMGMHKRSFVMDTTFDAEVWNYPLVNYRYSYYNPQTLQEVPNIQAAAVPIEKFRIDKFREFRSPKAKYVVGVYMDVSHPKALTPTRGFIRDPPLKTLRFIYDLELDAAMNVLGGEWYSNVHPDFIWTFAKNAQALAIGDSSLINIDWKPTEAPGANWTEAATHASERGTPLYSFLQKVIRAAGATHPGEEVEPTPHRE